jgi:hypothetical protein
MASLNILNPKDDIDKYEYREQGSPFRQLLWYCSGADVNLLMRCPQSERIKKEGIGGIVLATGGLAFISGSYAFYTVFSTGSFNSGDDLNLFAVLKAIIFGLMWAFVIFNLDRFIVSSTGKGDGTEEITWKEFKGAIPRIIMGTIIAITISKPVEIRMFKTEIDVKLYENQLIAQKRCQELINTIYNERIKNVEIEIDKIGLEKENIQNELECEINELSEVASILTKRLKELEEKNSDLEKEYKSLRTKVKD